MSPILALEHMCLYALKYEMSDNWSKKIALCRECNENTRFVVLAFSMGLDLSSSIPVLWLCAHTAACLPMARGLPTQCGKPCGISVSIRERAVVVLSCRSAGAQLRQPGMGMPEVGAGCFIFLTKTEFWQDFPCGEAEEPLLNQLWLKVWQDQQFQNPVMPGKLQKLPWLFEEAEF